MSARLTRSERLRGKDKIEALYKNGQSITNFPLKVIWMPTELPDASANIVFSVPKRKFKRAVDRNQIKRWMREAYRLNKQDLISELDKHEMQVSMFLIYLGKEIPDYSNISDKIIVLLSRLKEEISQIK